MSDYGHDEAMQDYTKVQSRIGYDENSTVDTLCSLWAYIGALEQENKTWEAEYALIKHERDEWEAIARVLAKNAATRDAGRGDKDADGYISWAREQVQR